MRRLSVLILMIVWSAAVSFAQTPWKGIRPGTSTRTEAELILGKPVRQISSQLLEYRLAGQGDRIFIYLRADSQVVDRIEAVLASLGDRAAILKSIGLPDHASASKTSSLGRLEEYFSSGMIVFTHDSDLSSGITRVGYCSREQFEKLSSDLLPHSPAAQPVLTPAATTAPAAAPRPVPPGTRTTNPSSGAPKDTVGEVGGFVVTGRNGDIELSAPPGAKDRQFLTASPSLPLTAYAGTYRFSPGAPWTNASVESSGGRLYWVTRSGKNELLLSAERKGPGSGKTADFVVEGHPETHLLFVTSQDRVDQLIYTEVRRGTTITFMAAPLRPNPR